MSRRMSKQVAELDPPKSSSEYLPGGTECKFMLRWVPLAPNVERRMERRQDGTWAETIGLGIGCPHCHEDVNIAWDVACFDTGLVRRLQEVLGELGSIEFTLLAALQPNETTRKLISVAEQLLTALKRMW